MITNVPFSRLSSMEDAHLSSFPDLGKKIDYLEIKTTSPTPQYN
jgi:hypothetical protein